MNSNIILKEYYTPKNEYSSMNNQQRELSSMDNQPSLQWFLFIFLTSWDLKSEEKHYIYMIWEEKSYLDGKLNLALEKSFMMSSLSLHIDSLMMDREAIC